MFPQLQTGFKYWNNISFTTCFAFTHTVNWDMSTLIVKSYAVWNTNNFMYFNLVLIFSFLGKISFHFS